MKLNSVRSLLKLAAAGACLLVVSTVTASAVPVCQALPSPVGLLDGVDLCLTSGTETQTITTDEFNESLTPSAINGPHSNPGTYVAYLLEPGALKQAVQVSSVVSDILTLTVTDITIANVLLSHYVVGLESDVGEVLTVVDCLERKNCLTENGQWQPVVFGLDGVASLNVLSDLDPVPLPPAMLLFGSALLGMNWLRRRRPMASLMQAAQA